MKYQLIRVIDDADKKIEDAFAAFVAYSKANKAYGTFNVRRYLAPLFIKFCKERGLVNLSDVGPEAMTEWRDRTMILYSPNTAHLYLETTSLMFKFAMERGWVFTNPMAQIKKPRLRCTGRALSKEERDLFFATLPKKYHRICWFALYTGLRIGECCRLSWRQIFSEYLYIPPEHSKNGQERIVVLSDKAKRYLGERGEAGPDESVFNTSRWYLQRAITATWKKLGIGRIRFHDLRHTLGTNYPDGQPVGLSLNLGHLDHRTTMKYRHYDLKIQAGIKSVDYGESSSAP